MDLRSAIKQAALIGATWTAAEIAELAGTPEHRSLAYCRLLVRQGVLVECDGGCFDVGPGLRDWSREKPKAVSSYGNSSVYLRQKAIRERLRQRAWMQGRGKEERPQPQKKPKRVRTLGAPPPPSRVSLRDMLAKDGLLPIPRVVEILGCSEWTVRRLIRVGKLPATRTGLRLYAINHLDLLRYIKDRMTVADEEP